MIFKMYAWKTTWMCLKAALRLVGHTYYLLMVEHILLEAVHTQKIESRPLHSSSDNVINLFWSSFEVSLINPTHAIKAYCDEKYQFGCFQFGTLRILLNTPCLVFILFLARIFTTKVSLRNQNLSFFVYKSLYPNSNYKTKD